MINLLARILENIAPMLAALLTGVALAVFLILPKPVWLIVGLAVWWLAFAVLAYLTRMRLRNIVLIFAHTITITALLFVIEWSVARIILITLSIFGSFSIFAWSAIDKHGAFIFKHKTWRRLIMMVWTFSVYAWITAITGVKIFFPGTPGWLVALLTALYAALATYMIWSLYQQIALRAVVLRLAILALLVAELAIIMVELPFGYLALGLLLTWVWYLMQLILRFELVPGGVIWKKQGWFLLGNAILMAVVVYFLRYI